MRLGNASRVEGWKRLVSNQLLEAKHMEGTVRVRLHAVGREGINAVG